MPSKYYNLSNLTEMVFDDLDFLQQIVSVFIEQMPIDAAELKNAVYHKQWNEAALKAHKIKSSVRTIGVKNLESQIITIEENCSNQNQLNQIESEVDDFVAKMNLVISDLKQETFAS